MVLRIDRSKCSGVDDCPECGLCIEICALNTMDNVNGQPEVYQDKCPECGLCVMYCPNNAIIQS